MKNFLTLIIISSMVVFSTAQDIEKDFPDQLSEEFHGLQFRNIGPYRGGRSNAVSGVKSQPLVYYMGTVGGGIYKTEDAGISWSNISDGQLSTGSVGAIAVAESDANVIYAGMGEHAVRGVMTSYGNGVYKSTDAGKTWKHVGLEGTDHISRVRIHPNNENVVYVAAQGAMYGSNEERGIYRSLDGGHSWNKILYVDSITGAADLSLDMINPRILYAAMWDYQRTPWQVRSGGPGSAIYKSVDGGDTWEKLSKGLPEEMGKISVDVSRADNQVVYANIEAAGDKGGVYRSDDAGKSWRQVNKNRVTVARAWYYIEIYADPMNTDVVYVMNAPFLKSIDGGKSFSSISVPHGDQHDLWINPDNPKNMINANDGGANISFNGGASWSRQDNQSTAQFYRVITDNQFPYRVYGGQQDNSTVSIQSRTNERGITEKDWIRSAGGESAFLAFDENNPTKVFGGSYQGNISYYVPEYRLNKDIMAYPVIGLGTHPKDMKYRFNWNAPIITDPFDPTIIYHGANVVLQSKDDGLSWEEISPDLTRNDTSTQVTGGIPFTNEGAGGENYNTISYMAASSLENGVIYVGTDDGLIHLTRDGGSTWVNVTPPRLEESLINAIHVSHLNPSRVIASVTRYKWDDKKPYIFISEDYGETWALKTNGISEIAYVRVVREDPRVSGLLYAGTELGLYVSNDLGDNWYPMQLNLPISPINDLTFRDNDLIIATSGRGFYILDDLGSIQAAAGDLDKNRIFLIPPKIQYKYGYNSPRRAPSNIGQNPLPGMIIDYFLPEDMDSTTFHIKIKDDKGQTIRKYSNKKDKENPGALVMTSKKGYNRMSWDLRKENYPKVPGLSVLPSLNGHTVCPGNYQAVLIYDEDSVSVDLVLQSYPGIDASYQDFQEQYHFLNEIESTFREVHESVNRVNKIKKQLSGQKALFKSLANTEELASMSDSIVKAIDQWVGHLIQPKQKTFQDIINFPNQLNAELLDLKSRSDGMIPHVSQGSRQRLADLQGVWDNYKNQLQEILEISLPEYEKHYQKAELPIIIIPKN